MRASELVAQARAALKLRWRRRRLLWRAFRSRHQLHCLADRTASIRRDDILCFATIRNEAERLPFFLDHYRRLGVRHFLIVDNASTDNGAALLSGCPDVSLWQTAHSYRASRFGMDWINHLLRRHGHGHWCLTVDADELLVHPHFPERTLHDLTRWLDGRGERVFAAMMLDLYPQGHLTQTGPAPGDTPLDALCWFDALGYRREVQSRYANLSIRGGVRERVFFPDRPDLSPHLHKTPLIRWQRGDAYLSSTHIALPRALNRGFLCQGLPTGVLLHTKFLPSITARAVEEKQRAEHFTHTENYAGYYDSLAADPVLWQPSSTRYQGAEQLEHLGLMTRGAWL
jgi:hypothetical protein